MKAYYFLFLLATFFLFPSCKKDNSVTDEVTVIANPSLNIGFRFRVDGPTLNFDTIIYENQAHNHYSVNTLVYYLSQISLIKSDSSVVEVKDWLFVDARSATTLDVSFKDIPKGCYTGISFNIGIDSIHNVQNGLPATNDNLMMEWPQLMGGGYHFLKLEGYFADSSGSPGYAMHLGTNKCLIKVQLPVSMCFDKDAVSKMLVMNVNEWFRTPNIFDFNVDGNYIMGDSVAMLKFAANGADVFSIE